MKDISRWAKSFHFCIKIIISIQMKEECALIYSSAFEVPIAGVLAQCAA